MRNAPGGVSRADDGFDETPTVNSPGALHREPPGVVARRRAPLGVPVCEEELNSPCTSIAETRDANLRVEAVGEGGGGGQGSGADTEGCCITV